MTGVKRGRGRRGLGARVGGAQITPSPFPFNPIHAGYTFFVIDWVSFGTPALLFSDLTGLQWKLVQNRSQSSHIMQFNTTHVTQTHVLFQYVSNGV